MSLSMYIICSANLVTGKRTVEELHNQDTWYSKKAALADCKTLSERQTDKHIKYGVFKYVPVE